MRDGDIIMIDALEGTIDLQIGDAELAKRKKDWQPVKLIAGLVRYGNMRRWSAQPSRAR